jgi:AraC-like DNA-binding protein
MIPTYSSDKTNNMKIVVNHLTQLNTYDFTEPHRHDYFEFFYFKKGGGTHYIDFVEFEIHDHSVHIVAPGQVHQMNRALDSEGYVVLFELPALHPPKEIEDFLFEHICLDAEELTPLFRFKQKEKPTLHALAESIYDNYKEGSTINQLKIVNEMQLFCLSCMEYSEMKDTPVHSDYMTFRKLIRIHYQQLKKVKDYAEKMNITERTLNDVVKQNSGKSASEVIYLHLVMEAKRLLRTGMSVKESAYALNFDDPGHFSKFFKNKTGESPSDFQNYT